MKHWGKALFGITVTVVLLWWALKDVSVAEVWTHIREGSLLLLLASTAVGTSGYVIRAMRWKVLLAPVRPDTSLRSRFAGLSMGFMANNVLPARVGEVVRAYALSRLEPVTASAAFGSLVVERLLDGVVLLLYLVLAIASPGFPGGEALSGGWVVRGAILLVAGIVGVVIMMAAWPRQLLRLIEWGGARLPERVAGPVVRGAETFLEAIGIMRDPKLLLLAFSWTLGFWAFHATSFWLGMMAFDIHTGYVSALFVSSVVAFGVAVPAAPGFIGTFHASAKFALSDVFGVAEPSSLAFAFGYWFAGWLPITLIGFWYAWRLGLSLGDVEAAEEQVEKEAEQTHEAIVQMLEEE